MAKYLRNLDLNGNQVKNLVIHKSSVEPDNPVEGQMYYNTSDQKLYLYSDNEWKSISSSLVEASAEQKQSDWNQTDDTQVDFIKNKPTKLSQFTNDVGLVINGGIESIYANLVWNEDETSLVFTTDSPLKDGVEYIVKLEYEGTFDSESPDKTMKFNDNQYIKTYKQDSMDTATLYDLELCHWCNDSADFHKWLFRAIYRSSDSSLYIIPTVSVMKNYVKTENYNSEMMDIRQTVFGIQTSLGDISSALDTINGEVI